MHKINQIKLNYRPDIDGLRAIAVSLVILYHAEVSFLQNTIVKSGFIGVDIFFVISGYLISLLIFKEIEITQKFSFLNFYERRARRILPALFFVMLLTFPLAWIYLMPENFIDYSKSVLYSIFFGSNFYFHYSGLVYGAPDSLLKPFLHTWSLSVEEQFYILFPISAIFFIKYFKKYLLSILIFIFIISFVLAEYGSRNFPSETFYFLHSRMWELMAGSILAYLRINKRIENKNLLINNFGTLLGISFIIIFIFFYDQNYNHPGYFTLIPVFGTCLIIWFSSKKNLVTSALSLKPIVGIGLLSYSLYLWHYPIFAIARTKDNTPSEYDKFEWIILTIILSIITFFLIERVFKNKIAFNKNKLFIYLSSLIVLIISVNIYVLANNGFSYKYKINENYTLDNSIYKKEWLAFRDKIGTPNFVNNKKTKVLIIGNSHGNDTFNMFHLNKELFKELQFSIINVHVSCFHFFINEKESLPLKCKYAFNKKDQNQVRKLFNESEILLLSTQWIDEDMVILETFINRSKKKKKKIILLNNALEVNTKIRRDFHILDFFVLNNKKLPNSSELEKIEKKTFNQLKNTDKINKKLMKISKKNNVKLLLKENYLCDSAAKKCEVLTLENKKISWDYSHYTLDGAKYLGEKVYKLNWFSY